MQFDDPQLGLFGPVLRSLEALKQIVPADLDALGDAMIGTQWRGLRARIEKGLAELERTAGRGERAAQTDESAATIELLWFVDQIMAIGEEVLSADRGGAFEVRITCGALRQLLLACDIEELALRLTADLPLPKAETTFSYAEVEAQSSDHCDAQTSRDESTAPDSARRHRAAAGSVRWPEPCP